MVLFFLSFLKLLTDFLKLSVGVLQSPYETYRKLATTQDVRYLPFIGGFILLSLFFSGLAKGGLAAHPLLLTSSFIKIVNGIALSFAVSVFLLGFLGSLVGGEKNWKRIVLLWGFSLLPTIFWFLLSSILALFLPPPRTMSLPGQLASGVYIALSCGLFFWKGILYYLTLRFALKLDLKRIVVVSAAFIPATFLYASGMYRLGVFRIPFI